MARTNSRKIQRRGLKKKSPVPAVLLILWIAALCMTFVYLHMSSSTLDFELQGKKADVRETKDRIRNLDTELAILKARPIILRKVEELNLGLRFADPYQVVPVHHIDSNGKGMQVQSLRETETLASRR